jgi:cell division protein FtsB
MAGTPALDGTQKGKRKRHLLAGITVSLGLVLAFLVIFTHQGLHRIYRLHQERQSLEQENSRLAAENNRLTRTIDRLQHDPELIQDLIRRELHFIKKNEIIFQLPPESGQKSGLPTPQTQAQRRRPTRSGR